MGPYNSKLTSCPGELSLNDVIVKKGRDSDSAAFSPLTQCRVWWPGNLLPLVLVAGIKWTILLRKYYSCVAQSIELERATDYSSIVLLLPRNQSEKCNMYLGEKLGVHLVHSPYLRCTNIHYQLFGYAAIQLITSWSSSCH